jgi:hypothetical protein
MANASASTAATPDVRNISDLPIRVSITVDIRFMKPPERWVSSVLVWSLLSLQEFLQELIGDSGPTFGSQNGDVGPLGDDGTAR